MLARMKQNALDKAAAIKEAKRSQSVPRSIESGRIRQARTQLPLRRPERMESEELNKNVAAKLQPFESVTNSILASVEERRGGGGTPLVKATCKDFVVGRAACAASSVVTLFVDRLEYKFSHTTQGRIDMVMYTKDMQAPELDARSLVLKFRVGKPLRHFIDAYDCTDSGHVLQLAFHDKSDAAAFAEALPTSCKVALQVLGGSL